MGNFEMPASRLDDYDSPFDTTGAVSGGEAGPAGEIEGQMTWDDLATEFANTEAPKPAEMPASKLDDAEPAQVATSGNEAMAGARALRALGMPPSTLGDDSPFDLSQVVELAGDRAKTQEDGESQEMEGKLRDMVLEAARQQHARIKPFYHDVASKAYDKFGNAISENIEDLLSVRWGDDTEEKGLERAKALISFIDMRFQNEGDADWNKQQKDSYRDTFWDMTTKTAHDSSDVLSDIMDNLGQVDGKQMSTLSEVIGDYADAQNEAEQSLASAYVAYIENPTKQAYDNLQYALNDKVNKEDIRLHDIAYVLGEHDDAVMRDMAQLIDDGKRTAGEDTVAYHEAIMEYIKFKIQQAGIEEVDESQTSLGKAKARVEALL